MSARWTSSRSSSCCAGVSAPGESSPTRRLRRATLIGRQLERVRELLLDGERPVAFTCAVRGSRLGALVVTDRRVLWAGKKAGPIVIERDALRGTRVTPRRMATSLELEIAGDDDVRFDAVEPAARTLLIVAALEPPAP